MELQPTSQEVKTLTAIHDSLKQRDAIYDKYLDVHGDMSANKYPYSGFCALGGKRVGLMSLFSFEGDMMSETSIELVEPRRPLVEIKTHLWAPPRPMTTDIYESDLSKEEYLAYFRTKLMLGARAVGYAAKL